MKATLLGCLIVLSIAAERVQANEAQVIRERDDFVSVVAGKALELTRPFLARGSIQLRVSPDGQITGTAMKDAVSGNWAWEGPYFCRVLRYGDEDLGRNCQVVTLRGDRVRFTADQGRGDWVEFALR